MAISANGHMGKAKVKASTSVWITHTSISCHRQVQHMGHGRMAERILEDHRQIWNKQDQGFMQLIADSQKFQTWQHRQINRCRMFLRNTTVSDLASPCGTKLHHLRFCQDPIPVENSTFTWSQQECPAPRY